MKRLLSLAALVVLAAAPALADTVIATRTIRAGSVLGPSDLTLADGDVPGALAAIEQGVGREAKVNLYAGRPVAAGDIGAPAIVDRNQIVPLSYSRGGLTITAEGRVMDRAGAGERVRVMNLDSRNTVTGTVLADGSVIVSTAIPRFASR